MVRVFQYGSNTSSLRLNSQPRLQGTAQSLGLALTEQPYEMSFSFYSSKNGCAAADLTPGGGRRVYGVLYEIPGERVFRAKSGGWTTLDDVEGEGEHYTRTTICVRLAGEEERPVEAYTYLVKDPEPGLRTCIDYVRHILLGLREHGAPQEYLDYVKSRIRSNNPGIGPELDAMFP